MIDLINSPFFSGLLTGVYLTCLGVWLALYFDKQPPTDGLT